jgi:hypothetical protein
MTTINHEVADLLQHEPEFEADEGYHTTKVLMLNDCDHGPCLGHTFDNGWIMYTYINDPSKISFHYAGTQDEPTPLKSYDVEIEAKVRKTITVKAGDETSAAEQAHEEFTVASNGDPEHYEQDTLSITENNTHE